LATARRSYGDSQAFLLIKSNGGGMYVRLCIGSNCIRVFCWHPAVAAWAGIWIGITILVAIIKMARTDFHFRE
jgi:hypothetical protein